MRDKQVIHSSKIKNLITKFYYKENQLCFQILLACENGETKLYKEYMDYAKYKEAYDQLLEMKATEEFVLTQGNEVRTTNMNFV